MYKYDVRHRLIQHIFLSQSFNSIVWPLLCQRKRKNDEVNLWTNAWWSAAPAECIVLSLFDYRLSLFHFICDCASF